MKIATIIDEHYDAFVARYKDKILPGHLKALNAMRHCRTPEAGELYVRCPDCDYAKWQPMSCGHRICPQCQNHETSRRIDRQRNKLLPVQYFMVTFTLPCELRSLAYLYRGVISERNIVAHENGQVTFRYTESKTGKSCLRTLKGEDFLRLILRHVLPRGFRRVRDYGFLHSNAKKMLTLVQLVLHVRIHVPELRQRPTFTCPCCKSSMLIIGFRPPGIKPG